MDKDFEKLLDLGVSIKDSQQIYCLIINGILFRNRWPLLSKQHGTVEVISNKVYIDSCNDIEYFNKIKSIFKKNGLEFVDGKSESPAYTYNTILEIYSKNLGNEDEVRKYNTHYRYTIKIPEFMDFEDRELVIWTKDYDTVCNLSVLIKDREGLEVEIYKREV